MGKIVDPAFLGNVVILAHKGFTVGNIAKALDTSYSRVRGTLDTYQIPYISSHARSRDIAKEFSQLVKEGGEPAAVRRVLARKHKVALHTIYNATLKDCL